MKKNLIALSLILILALSLCICAFAAEGSVEMRYVVDTYGLLSFDQWASLENRAANISEQHGCGTYIVTVDDYRNYGDGSVYDVTTQIYHRSGAGFGMGSGRDGIMLLLSMNNRKYALFVYGEKAEYAFNDDGLEQLEEVFLGDLGNDNWLDGFSGYLKACDQFLTRAEEGEPVRDNPLGLIAIAVAVSCGIALVICLILKSMMKTVHRKAGASEYVADGGLHLTQQIDQYTHTTKTRRKIEKNPGSSGGSHSERGAGGIGRSGSF